MQPSEIDTRLTEIFRDIFDDDDLTLRPEMTAADVKDWDSFNHINLIVATEAKFGIKFQTAEIESLKNVGHFEELIAKKLAAQGR
ncbi:MAG: acyl carrier protein [Acidobacteriaceae bacterium]|jgi:acyl carrier protein|nr:acyl carrier protein [Acidobacteriaceae bacterium]